MSAATLQCACVPVSELSLCMTGVLCTEAAALSECAVKGTNTYCCRLWVMCSVLLQQLGHHMHVHYPNDEQSRSTSQQNTFLLLITEVQHVLVGAGA